MFYILLLFLLQNVTAQLGQIIAYEAMRFSECQGFISTCPPVTQSCASIACQQCYSLGDATFRSCCGQPTPSYCFSTEYGSPNNKGGGNPYVTTSIDPNLAVCQTAVTMISDCESATSNFDNLDGTAQAECLCYSGTSWIPSMFDMPFSSCVVWASTADVSDYQGFLSGEGLCASAGNVLAAVASSSGIRSVVASTTAATSSPKTSSSVNVITSPTASVVEGSTSTPTSSVVKPTSSTSGSVYGMKRNIGSVIPGLLALLMSQWL